MHASNIIWMQQVIFKKLYIYTNTYACTNKRENINLKNSGEGVVGDLEEGKGRDKCCNEILI